MIEDLVGEIAADLEVREQPDEPREQFRKRVATAFYEVSGEPLAALTLLTGLEFPGCRYSATPKSYPLAGKVPRKHGLGTYQNMPWAEFLGVPESEGFTFVDERPREQESTSKSSMRRYVHRDLGIIMCADSYMMSDESKTLSSITMAYEIAGGEGPDDASFSAIGEMIYEQSLGIFEGNPFDLNEIVKRTEEFGRTRTKVIWDDLMIRLAIRCLTEETSNIPLITADNRYVGKTALWSRAHGFQNQMTILRNIQESFGLLNNPWRYRKLEKLEMSGIEPTTDAILAIVGPR
jgi:hypothetical protein